MERARIVAWSAEMRRVHQRLADALVITRESIESGDQAPPLLELTCCWAFCTAPDGHLARDHRMIGQLLGACWTNWT